MARSPWRWRCRCAGGLDGQGGHRGVDRLSACPPEPRRGGHSAASTAPAAGKNSTAGALVAQTERGDKIERKKGIRGEATVWDDWGVSIRRACSVLEFDRFTYHYKSRRREQAGLEARIKEICATRVRYGYRRVHVLLRREGWEINLKKTHRIYNELGLQLRNKTPKRRVKAKLRDDRRAASTSNEIWAMDFVHDQLATGQRIRVLTVVDTFSRFSPVIDPRFSYRAEDVVTALEGACASTGYPKTIRVDQGSEFVSRGLREGRHAGLLTARQTYRQRLHRGIQRPPARRVPERALVSDPCRRPGKVGGLAQVLQRGSTAWGNRQQAPGFPHDSHRRIQPAGVTKAGKLYLPAVQQSGADHSTRDSSPNWMKSRGSQQASFAKGCSCNLKSQLNDQPMGY